MILPRVNLTSNMLFTLSTNEQILVPISLPSIEILHPVNAELPIYIGRLIKILGSTPRGCDNPIKKS